MTDAMEDLRQASAEVSGIEILSPACVAVRAAYYERLKAVSADCATEDQALAAALRAAADEQCRPSDWRPPFSSDEIDAAEWWLAGYEAAVEEIKARFDLIAAELGAQP